MSKHQDIKQAIRSILQESEIASAMAAGRTVDMEGLYTFLRQEGLLGHEENILSIVEGQPTEKVLNDVTEYISFHKLGTDPQTLSADILLDYYLQWNNLNIDKSQVLAFSIQEK